MKRFQSFTFTLKMFLDAAANTASKWAYYISLNNLAQFCNTTHPWDAASLGVGPVAGFVAIPSSITAANSKLAYLQYLWPNATGPYGNARVHTVHYKVALQPQNLLDTGYLIVAPLAFAGAFNSTDMSSLSATPFAKSKTVTSSVPSTSNMIAGKIDLWTLNGLTKDQYCADLASFANVGATPPLNNCILEVAFADGTSSVLSNNIVHSIQLTYDIEFFELYQPNAIV